MAVTVVMIIGAICIGSFTIPSLFHVLRTRNTIGVNFWMYLVLLLACIFFAIYGLGMSIDGNYSGGLPTLISNIACIISTTITLVIKIKNIRAAKKAKLTEEQFWRMNHEKHIEVIGD